MRATSSRRSVSSALFAALACSALSCRRGEGGEPCPVRLGVRPGPRPEPRPREGLYLALASIDDGAREALLDHLASALASADPMVVDLSGDRVADVIGERRAWLLPALNAALTLADGAFPLGEQWVVPLGNGAPAEPGSVCAWGAERDGPSAERLRAAAWPLAFGFVARFAGEGEARHAASSLRRSAAAAGGALSLVVDAAAARAARAIELGELPSLARRASRAGQGALEPLEQEMLSALSASGPLAPPLGWLPLSANELFLAPRQGALARPAEVLASIARAVGKNAGPVMMRGRGASGERPLSSMVGW